MDETLVDWSQREGTWLEHSQRHLEPIHQFLARQGQPVQDLDGFARVYGEQMQKAWLSINPPDWDCPQQIDILRDTLLASNLDMEKVNLQEIEKLFGWGLVPGVKTFADTEATLRDLREAGIKTGLLTNAAMPMWMRDEELKTLGILDLLDVRITAGDVGKFKPHPHPFRVVLDRLKVMPEEAVFVGDRVQDDVVGAQAAGMKAIWVQRGTTEVGMAAIRPNATVNNLSDILRTFDQWFPGWRNSPLREAVS
jgi:putative hydrolase of the HAD superfamily